MGRLEAVAFANACFVTLNSLHRSRHDFASDGTLQLRDRASERCFCPGDLQLDRQHFREAVGHLAKVDEPSSKVGRRELQSLLRSRQNPIAAES